MELLVVFGIAVLVAGLLAYANEKDLKNQDIFSQDFNHSKNNAGYTCIDDNSDSDDYYDDYSDYDSDSDYYYHADDIDDINDISNCYLNHNIYHDLCTDDDFNISGFDDDWNYSSWDD